MIAKESTLPEIIGRYPGTRRVFDDAGLHGCGGPRGPHETVEFFARVHGVPLEKLLADLEAAKEAPAPGYREDLGDILYRRFFRAAVVVVLSAGATLGATMLFFYGQRRSFTSLDLFPPIQAHANAQVFGWVGLMVMGFACQGFPRFKYVRLWRPDLANLSFVGMAGGLVLRMAAAWPWVGAIPLGLGGGVLEAASVVLFATVLTRTLRQSAQRDGWDRYVRFSLACFVAVAVLEPLAFWLTRPGVDPALLVPRVADFMGPYRNVQLLGFAGILILGVAQRILPTAFGFREVGRGVGRRAFLLLSCGLGLDVLGWILFRATRSPGWALASWLGTSAYAVGALLVAIELRGFSRGDQDRSTKFIRAAFCWLAVAAVMVLAEPFYARALGLRFSHAYHGAIRHAFTVGFISLMILGVSSKVVPILQGVDVRALPGLGWPFLLLNVGNSLRVLSQVATDLAPAAAFPVMGMSGAFEVAGLGIWGFHLWKLLGMRPAPEAARGAITAESRVAWVADEFPATLDVFDEFGFKELRNPLLRNTLARKVTVRMACGMKHVDEEKFLAALQDRARAARSSP